MDGGRGGQGPGTGRNRDHDTTDQSQNIQAGVRGASGRESISTGTAAEHVEQGQTGLSSSSVTGSMSIRRRLSVSEKTPTRSFYHRSFHGPVDAGHYSSQGVRERTAELESLAMSDENSVRSRRSFLGQPIDLSSPSGLLHGREDAQSERFGSTRPEAIQESSEPCTPRGGTFPSLTGESALSAMLRTSPPQHTQRTSATSYQDDQLDRGGRRVSGPSISAVTGLDPEQAPLIGDQFASKMPQGYGTSSPSECEDDNFHKRRPWRPNFWYATKRSQRKCLDWWKDNNGSFHPKTWNRRTILQKGIVEPAALLPAVFLGLLLNILDALSYGMILFPLGEPIFASLGSAGIAMFYVSTIISQLVFSCGGSIFKGGVGSEMIEVVPFFHKMAYTILARVGPDNPRSVIATTILAYAISSLMTGAVFFAMGACGLGSIIGFFPRHILIGCIGGVGWFLLATAIEISARLPGNLQYNFGTLEMLFEADRVFLWTIPLALAIGLLVLKRYVQSNFLLGGYFLSIAGGFYIVIFILGIPLETLRENNWVFDAPSSPQPWYYFYTLYDIPEVSWSALGDTIPAMLALTFFSILHVPINVPALGISTGEDNLNVDRELIAHGISNALSGFSGSVQNYLVYTNSLLFIASGGDSRLAGIMLAVCTFGILLAGPALVGYIPIMVVGALIFMLGVELLEEAVVDTWGRLHKLEYITVVIIVVTMGAWDFVAGIVVGIILACVNFVAQASQKSAITATYTGEVAVSTVRRHPLHARFLKEAGKQTTVIKLAGFLFFGTIVSVEKRIRRLIEEEEFRQQPIRFLVLDVLYVKGLDFSAAEAFTRLNRILQKRGVYVIICGLDLTGDVGKSLQNVGLFKPENNVRIFQDMNSALEYCENEHLKVIHERGNAADRVESSEPLPQPHKPRALSLASDMPVDSPRDLYLQRLASNVLREEAEESPSLSTPGSNNKKLATSQQYPHPYQLLLQTFQGLTNKPGEFWLPAVPYFIRNEFPTSSILYREGDFPKNFYLLESGMIRAEYETPQGNYFELVVAGRPCGELPFFGETSRTATVRAERDSVVWMLGSAEWAKLMAEEPIVALEMMKVCLKLTAERMESITSYVLTATR